MRMLSYDRTPGVYSQDCKLCHTPIRVSSTSWSTGLSTIPLISDRKKSKGYTMNSTFAWSFDEENVTATSTTNALTESPSYGLMVFLACVWIVVAVLGVVGNSTVILSVILSKLVQTSTNVLVINLSVADLLTSLSLPWTSVAMLSDGTWPLSTEVPCQIAAFLFHTGLGASLYNLALIALNRLVRLTRPLATYNRIFSPRKMACIVTFSWLVPIFVIVFPLTIGVGGLGYDVKHASCSDDDMHPRADEYNLAQTISFFPVPMATVLISYLAIHIYIRRHFREQLSRNKSRNSVKLDPSTARVTSTSSGEATAESKEGRGGQRKISRQQLRITKNLFVVFCAFMLCLSPYFIGMFFPLSDTVTLHASTIVIFNSCVNPVIYGAKHPQFKRVLRPMLRCRWEKIPKPSKALKAVLARRQQEDEV
ncbi:melatonin receptor type 1A-like [Acanthaster planci]|uniref:Melatonin receptor type 1A-like n=1 Tax=Acanthaster planci TaxID=133434 RepID=A0A8B7XL97_ACAPL|nr:melatonin receptor type 1A-like [Acanthaster planci]